MMSATNLAALVFAAVILVRAEPALARMSPCTPWMLRYAFLLLAAGAMAVILMVCTGQVPPAVAILLLTAGLALLLLCDRRMRALLPINRKGEPHAQG